ncbi:MAG: PAS domain S-box protein [Thiotrichaceae bacterium]|nr:PAS domain S-box protein [Thiotrichaceae bacterium]PCI13920.1 MAG: hypothetical protein COB71_04445 [Thiotrichales bacterium]
MLRDEIPNGNKKSTLMRFLMALVVCFIVAGGVFLVDRTKKIERDWDQYSSHRSGESDLISRLYRHMGYGGFIHNFKNFVIRRDEPLLDAIELNLSEILVDLEEYEVKYITAYEVEFTALDGRHQALELRKHIGVIREVIEQYILKLAIAKKGVSEGVDAVMLDRQLKVDDSAAIAALDALFNHVKEHAKDEVTSIRHNTDNTIGLIVLMLVILVSTVALLLYIVTMVNRQYLASKIVAEENKDALNYILNSLSDSVIMVDEKAQLIWANEAVREMFGYEPSELVGENINCLLPQESRDGHYDLFKHYLEKPVPLELGVGKVLRAVKKGGETFPVEISLNTVTLNSHLMAIAAIHDITERIIHENKIEALNQSLIRNNRELNEINKELESFSYSVSHDLRGPLRAIGGFSSLLTEKYKNLLDEDAQDYLARIRRSSKRMGELIDSLLNLSRYVREGIEPVEFNLDELAQSIFNRINDSTDIPSDTEVEIQSEMSVIADYQLMDVVIYNLMSNAFKFTRKVKNARIKVGMTSPEGGQDLYFVSDNGEGFDLAYADRLFLPFHRLHHAAEYEGSGIGLATVQRIIRRHGGRVWADSAPGVGTTFYFTLSNPH